MIKYRCPECGASCNTSHCYDCDIDIPMSQRFDDAVESGPSKEYKPIQNVSYHDTTPGTSSRYKCPDCGAICQSAYCFTCEKNLPFSAQYNAPSSTSYGNVNTLHYKTSNSSYSTTSTFDKKIGLYFAVDSYNKRFKIKGDGSYYTFGDLVNYELYENNSVIQKGGIGRAIVGGALFGEVGAIVGAQTRKSQNFVDSLYIRITLKSSGMKKITFINSPTDRNSMIYKMERKSADEVLSELDLISAENQNEAIQTAAQTQYEPQPAPPPIQQTSQPEQSPTLIADELLKLKQLLDMGVLTQEEFNQQKQKLLNN